MSIVLRSITDDLNWREAEIASMRVILSSRPLTKFQERVLLRAAWPLLYAHYEGFCKNALTIYYEHIRALPVTCKDLPTPTRLLALNNTLNTLRSLPNADLISSIDSFSTTYDQRKPIFPEVKADSNLWPSKLKVMLIDANLSTEIVEQNAQKLKTLVGRRNGIAHGENNIIEEVSYYNTYEKAVYDVMYDLAFQIDHRLNLSPYNVN